MTIAVAGLAWACVLLLALLWRAGRAIERDRRIHDRRVDDLLNRLAHATRHPWVPAPVEDDYRPEQAGPKPRVLELIDPDQETGD